MNDLFLYAAYGLVFELPFACPALPPAPEDSAPDVIVSEGPVPTQLADLVDQGAVWQSGATAFLSFAGRRVGRFLIEEGRRITIQRSPAATDARLCLHLLTSAMSIVLRQRGMLVLHASAVAGPNGALVLTGAPGSGKSTTLAALLQKGCQLLADDLTAIRIEGGGALVVPGVPQFKLGRAAAANLGQVTDGLTERRGRRMKLVNPAAVACSNTPLRAFCQLQPEDTQSLRCELVTGARKFEALDACLYGPVYPADRLVLFPLVTAVLARTAVYRVIRPIEGWSVDAVVETLLGSRETSG